MERIPLSNRNSNMRRLWAALTRRISTWICATTCVIAGALIFAAVDRGQQAPTGQPVAAGGTDRPASVPQANHSTAANQPIQTQDSTPKNLIGDAGGAARKKQFSDESARLLKLANELKVEVDKSDKDTLSIAVIKKADEIEKLAHSVREKMKLTVAAN